MVLPAAVLAGKDEKGAAAVCSRIVLMQNTVVLAEICVGRA